MEMALCSLLHWEIGRFGDYERTPRRFLTKPGGSELPTQAQREEEPSGWLL